MTISLQAQILHNPSDLTLWQKLDDLSSSSLAQSFDSNPLAAIKRGSLAEDLLEKLSSQAAETIHKNISKLLSEQVIDISESRFLAIVVAFWKGDTETALILGGNLVKESSADSPSVKAYHSIVDLYFRSQLGSSQILHLVKSVFDIQDQVDDAQMTIKREVAHDKIKSSISTLTWQERPGWPAIKECTENDPTARFIIEYYMSALDGVGAIPKPISLSDKPVVSVVIPVYNHWPLLYNCLKSIGGVNNKIPFEVIVADDCSTDETSELIALNPWVRHVRMEKNGRFILNCNNAARVAKGEYIYFLNNDTIVLDGWLDHVVATFQAREDAGIIGSQVLFPDSSVQESGGIIWPDGEAWNYGRHIDKDNLFKANYSRPVDYVSGCALAIKKTLWQDVGGFGEEFVPAYCEDSDLCFKVKSRNQEVWVQPLSKIIHFEGLSNSKDITQGLKLYQKINLQKLNQKWKLSILKRGIGDTKFIIHASNRRLRSHKTILVVDHYVPQPDKDAGSRTVKAFCESLINIGWNVIFLPENFTAHEPYTSELEGLGIMVLHGSQAANSYEDILRNEILLVDAILFNRPHITQRFRKTLCNIFPSAKTLYYTHDLHGLREQLESAWASLEFGMPIEIDQTQLLRADEEDIVRNVDVSLVCSSKEQALLSKFYSNVALVSPYAVAIPATQGLPYQSDYQISTFEFLFVGGFGHTPNRVGLDWFVDNVMPLLPTEYVLHVVGSRCPEDLQDKLENHQKIIYHGFVSDIDLAALLSRLRVSIAPLPYGAGIKGKVVEALAAGHTVIGTEYGIEGMDDRPEDVYITCSNAQEFVQALTSVFARNSGEWPKAQRDAKQYVQQKFNAESIERIFYEHLGSPLRAKYDQSYICFVSTETSIEGMHLMPSTYGIEHDGWLLRSNRLVFEPMVSPKSVQIKCYIPDDDTVSYQGSLELYIKILLEDIEPLALVYRLEKGVNILDLHLPSKAKTSIIVIELDPGYAIQRSNSDDIRDLVMLINSIVLS